MTIKLYQLSIYQKRNLKLNLFFSKIYNYIFENLAIIKTKNFKIYIRIYIDILINKIIALIINKKKIHE